MSSFGRDDANRMMATVNRIYRDPLTITDIEHQAVGEFARETAAQARSILATAFDQQAQYLEAHAWELLRLGVPIYWLALLTDDRDSSRSLTVMGQVYAKYRIVFTGNLKEPRPWP